MAKENKPETAIEAALRAAGHVPEIQPVIEAPLIVKEPEPPKVVITPLTAPRLRLVHASESDSGNTWRATAPRGTPWEHALHDEFWTGVADKLRYSDKIELFSDDKNYAVTLVVFDTDSNTPHRRVSVSRYPCENFASIRKVERAEEYIVDNRGDYLRWCVIHKATNVPKFDKLYTKEEADERLRSFLRGQADVRRK